jgi:hypothetical protein
MENVGMNNYILGAFVMSLAIVGGCARSAGNGDLAMKSIVGLWESDVGTSELGRGITQIEFTADGKVRMRTIVLDQSPPGELVADGSYTLSGNQLSSDIANKGKPVRVLFRRDELVIQTESGPPSRLHRVLQ